MLGPHRPYLAVGLRFLGRPVGLGLAALDAEAGCGARRHSRPSFNRARNASV